jgi:hypothetical protein
MALELYDNWTLLEVQRRTAPEEEMFWLRYFPRTITSQSEDILFDQITEADRRLAPFVAPNVQGRVLREKGFKTLTFRPAYVKPKHVVDPSRAIPRRAGEPLGGNMSMLARYNAIIAANMQTERTLIERRWNWMAAQAIINGAVTVSGEDYPTVTVDFGRNAALSRTLTSTARWGEADADPLGDIEDSRQAAFDVGYRPINNIIFGLNAYRLFAANTQVRELLNNNYRLGNSQFQTAAFSLGGPFESRGQISTGAGGAVINLWTYADKYEDASGSLVDYLDTNTVVGVGDGVNGYRCFGAIRDKRAGLASLEMFPRMWDEEDPSVTYTMTQSAPLMVPGNVDNTFKLKVR